MDPRRSDISPPKLVSALLGYNLLPAIVFLPTRRKCDEAASEVALDKIQYKALESFVPALGYNKGFPREVILGPIEYGGIGMPHIYTEMNATKIEYLIMHIRYNTELGKLFRINLNWLLL